MYAADMKDQLALQKVLKDRLAEAQQSNPRYSLRAFSKKVGIHFAALSAIMNGKRLVSVKIATRIADSLELDPQERTELLALFPQPKSKLKQSRLTGIAKPANYIQMDEKQTSLAMEWEYFAVMSLLQCSEFQSSIPWLAHRLNVSQSRMKEVIDRLLDAHLLLVDENGNFSRPKENFRTPDDVSALTIKKAHEQTLQLARESLFRDPIETRDFTFVTVAVNTQKLKCAKELIRKFQDELCDFLEEGPRTEVYRLSMQLFPLTKVPENH